MMKVLIIEDEPSVSYYLREVVVTLGHAAESVGDGALAVDVFNKFKPDLVICDIRMPHKDGFQILEEIRRRDHEVIFIMMTGYGSEEFAIRALELRANNYLHKPIRFEMIGALIEKYNERIRSRLVRKEVHRMVTRRQTTIEVPNRLERVSDVVDLMVGETVGWLTDDERFSIQLGLYELIVNAIEHGNLEITYEEKNRALYEGPSRYTELVRQRLEDPARINRRVLIEFRFENNRLEWIITDEGKGFNWYSLPNPLAAENHENLNGRGIFLARIQFDELTFLGSGNRVRAVKKVIGREAALAADTPAFFHRLPQDSAP